jgi:hypothetical protein
MTTLPLNFRVVRECLTGLLARAEEHHAEERGRAAFLARLPALFPPDVVASIIGDPTDERAVADIGRMDRYHGEFSERWFPIVPLEDWGTVGFGVCADAAYFDPDRCAERLADPGWATLLAVILGRQIVRRCYEAVADPVADRLATLHAGPLRFGLLEARFADTPDAALVDVARWILGTTGCQLLDIDAEGMDTFLSFDDDDEIIEALRDEWQGGGRALVLRCYRYAGSLRADPAAALTRLLATLGPVTDGDVEREDWRWQLSEDAGEPGEEDDGADPQDAGPDNEAV